MVKNDSKKSSRFVSNTLSSSTTTTQTVRNGIYLFSKFALDHFLQLQTNFWFSSMKHRTLTKKENRWAAIKQVFNYSRDTVPLRGQEQLAIFHSNSLPDEFERTHQSSAAVQICLNIVILFALIRLGPKNAPPSRHTSTPWQNVKKPNEM